MQIFEELNKNPNLSLALGFFDGLHLGHKAVIEKAVEFARENGTKSAVITFIDHPLCYLKGINPEYILTRKDRENKIEKLGVDFLYELDFESISGLTAQDYLKDVLINNFMPSAISTGWNHNFGCKKSGNVKFLHETSNKYGYEYFELPPQKLENEVISSTSIRKYLADGKIEKANQMLGYDFSIQGVVIKGNQIGRTIGFKTANILYPDELIKLPYGVYAVDTNFGKGIANFGIRPTVSGTKTTLEVHILNFDNDIYGQNINISFSKMIRAEKKFHSLEDLKLQIQRDISTLLAS